MIGNDFLWTEKYRPKTISDTILPDRIKKTFQKFVEDGIAPNLLLTGKSGVGKTTVARALLEEIEADYIIINGSLEGRAIETLRNTIHQFASTVSFSGGRKYVILDEADYLNPNSVQPALRNFMEEFSKNCGFIMTCNYQNKIIEPLHSRCSVISFSIDKSEKMDMVSQFVKRVFKILKQEQIKYDPEVVATVVLNKFPDWRKALNEFQAYSATGAIDTGLLSIQKNAPIKELMGLLKDKNVTETRKWVATHSDIEPHILFRQIYDMAEEFLNPAGVAQMIVLNDEYLYKSAFVADQEINTASFLMAVMINCNGAFK